jgi:hypothetical protein
MEDKSKFENQNIIKYEKHIEGIAKYVCHCCQRLCFDFQVCRASTSHFKTISPSFENLNLDNKKKICKYCRKKFNPTNHWT